MTTYGKLQAVLKQYEPDESHADLKSYAGRLTYSEHLEVHAQLVELCRVPESKAQHDGVDKKPLEAFLRSRARRVRGTFHDYDGMRSTPANALCWALAEKMAFVLLEHYVLPSEQDVAMSLVRANQLFLWSPDHKQYIDVIKVIESIDFNDDGFVFPFVPATPEVSPPDIERKLLSHDTIFRMMHMSPMICKAIHSKMYLVFAKKGTLYGLLNDYAVQLIQHGQESLEKKGGYTISPSIARAAMVRLKRFSACLKSFSYGDPLADAGWITKDGEPFSQSIDREADLSLATELALIDDACLPPSPEKKSIGTEGSPKYIFHYDTATGLRQFLSVNKMGLDTVALRAADSLGAPFLMNTRHASDTVAFLKSRVVFEKEWVPEYHQRHILYAGPHSDVVKNMRVFRELAAKHESEPRLAELAKELPSVGESVEEPPVEERNSEADSPTREKPHSNVVGQPSKSRHLDRLAFGNNVLALSIAALSVFAPNQLAMPGVGYLLFTVALVLTALNILRMLRGSKQNTLSVLERRWNIAVQGFLFLSLMVGMVAFPGLGAAYASFFMFVMGSVAIVGAMGFALYQVLKGEQEKQTNRFWWGIGLAITSGVMVCDWSTGFFVTKPWSQFTHLLSFSYAPSAILLLSAALSAYLVYDSREAHPMVRIANGVLLASLLMLAGLGFCNVLHLHALDTLVYSVLALFMFNAWRQPAPELNVAKVNPHDEGPEAFADGRVEEPYSDATHSLGSDSDLETRPPATVADFLP